MTLCDHVIKRLCDVMDNKPALEPATLSSFLAIVLAKVEIKCFLSVTWSLRHVVKTSKGLMYSGPLLKISTFPSLAFIAFGEVEIYCFYFVTGLYVNTLWEGHITLPVVVLQLVVLMAKCGGHKSCGSQDLIYFNL